MDQPSIGTERMLSAGKEELAAGCEGPVVSTFKDSGRGPENANPLVTSSHSFKSFSVFPFSISLIFNFNFL